MDIGLLVKQYRQANNLTLREFAARCGTSHSYIAMLESHKNSKTGEPIIPTIAMIKKLSQGMNMSVNEIIAICDDMPISLDGASDIKKNPTAASDGISEKRKALIEFAMTISEEEADRALQALKLLLKTD